MKKSVFIFLFFLISLIVSDEIYALPGGLMDGKPFYRPGNGTPIYKITDNDPDTKYAMSGTITFTFDEPKNISRCLYNGTTVNDYYFYAEDGYILKKAKLVDLPTLRLQKVKKVSIIHYLYNGYINEFDCFEMKSPDPPEGITGTGENGSAKIEWLAVNNPDIVGYFVYKDGVRLFQTPIERTTFTVTGLTNGKEYSFQVSSVDVDGVESKLSEIVFITPRKTSSPPIPLGLKGSVLNETVRLVWNEVNAPDLAGYYVYQDGLKISELLTNNGYEVNGLNNYQTYTFQVTAEDTWGNESPKSSAIRLMPLPEEDTTPPQVPRNPRLSVNDSLIQINWDIVPDVDLAGYNIYRDGNKLNPDLHKTNTYIDRTVENDVLYGYSVSAVDYSGNESDRSETVYGKAATSNVPKITLGYWLADIVTGISNWFGSLWWIIAFAIAIPLSFLIGRRVKNLFT